MKSPIVVSEADSGAKSLKGLRTRYIFVLAVVGVLALSSYLLLGITLQQQDTAAAEINLAGRQRMLSQRLELLQVRFREAKSSEVGTKSLLEMTRIVDLMEKTHIGLTRGDEQIGLSAPRSQALKKMYFGPDLFVDRDVRNFIEVMRLFIQAAGSGAGTTNSALGVSPTSSVELLSNLDKIVWQSQKENEEKVAQIQFLRHLTVIVTLGSQGVVVVPSMDSIENDGPWAVLPPEVQVIDTTAAGDCFNGLLAAELARGQSLSQAVEVAVVGASISVTRVGAQTSLPMVEEIEPRIRTTH